MSKWSSQPVCGSCWQAYSYGAKGNALIQPVQMRPEHIEFEKDVCCFCSGWAEQGIYLRVDEEKVPFPNLTAQDALDLHGKG